MKYGKIIDSKVHNYGRIDTNGKWQGAINYNEKGERLLANETIEKLKLKEIIVPTDFNGNYNDYSVEENDTSIILGGLTATARNRKETAFLASLREQREKECFSVVNRGNVWYDLLVPPQKDDLNKWYIEWLNVTETLIEPTVPDSIKELI